MGYDELVLYLIERGANPNMQTNIKGYSCLHLAVLANKPEIIIEMLTKTQANPYLPDFGGRILQDMVEIFIPSYIESFKTLIENLEKLQEEEGKTAAYVNPDDERSIQGVGIDQSKANDLYTKKAEGEQEAPTQKDGAIENVEEKKNALINF